MGAHSGLVLTPNFVCMPDTVSLLFSFVWDKDGDKIEENIRSLGAQSAFLKRKGFLCLHELS